MASEQRLWEIRFYFRAAVLVSFPAPLTLNVLPLSTVRAYFDDEGGHPLISIATSLRDNTGNYLQASGIHLHPFTILRSFGRPGRKRVQSSRFESCAGTFVEAGELHVLAGRAEGDVT